MLSQTNQQNEASGVEIERLLRTELKDTVEYYIKKYGKTFSRRLGLTRSDLLNDVREQIWKGLLTHDPSKPANRKTYMNTLIKNRFGVLLKRAEIKKYKNVTYYADVFTSTGLESEFITEETGETVFERRQVIMNDLAMLGDDDRRVYMQLLLGSGMDEMEKATGLPRPKVIGAINRIDTMIRNRPKSD
jgi:hypothetical protein